TSTVQLASDPTAVVGVRFTGSGQLGWVTGTSASREGGELLRLRVLGSGQPITVGQQLVTAGSVANRPYVPGIPVGVVTGVQPGAALTTTALVRPFADFTALDVVGVVVSPPSRRGAGG
ncbi:MAG: rod shape-determining protein MreC, partial [Nocardiopsaceae bacterium]|nr:rod shape-determining protein MreC [Nocardiopsaceae bacterium]